MTAVLETARLFRRRLALPVMVCAVLAFPAFAQEFPLTLEHKFGTTVIPAKPEVVASVDYAGAEVGGATGLELPQTLTCQTASTGKRDA